MNSGEFIELKDPNEGNNPTQEEIEEYAQWLGADLEKDQDLFWIAREALTVSLPPGWKVYQRRDGSGDPFYFNSRTGESLWDHPLDAHFKELFLKEKAKKEEMQKAPASNRPQASLGNKIERKSQEQFEFQPNQQPISIGNHSSGSNNRSDDTYKSGDESDEEEEEEEENEKLVDDKLNNLRQKQADEEKALNQLIQHLQEEKAKVQQDIDNLKNDKTLQNLQQENQKKIEEEKQRFAKEMKDLKERNSKEIEEEKKKHQQIMSQLKQDQEKQITAADVSKQANENSHQLMTLKIQLEQQSTDLKKQYQAELEELSRQHSNNIDNLEKKNQAELQKLIAENNQQKDAETQRLQKELQKLQNNFNKQKQQIEQEMQKQQQIEQQAVQSNKQDLEQMKTKYESQINQMKSDYQSQFNDMKSRYEEEIKNLRKKVKSGNSVTFASPDSGKQLRALSESYESKKKDLEEQYEDEIQTMTMQHEQEVNRLKRQQQKQINSKNQEINNMLSKLTDEFENQKSELELQNQTELDKLNIKHKKAVQKLKKQNQAEIESINEEHEEEIERIQNDNKKQIDKLKQKHQKAIEKEKNDHELQLQRIKDKNEQKLKQNDDYFMQTPPIQPFYSQQPSLFQQKPKPFLIHVNVPVFSQRPQPKRPLISSDMLYFCGSNRLPFFSIDEKIIISVSPKQQQYQSFNTPNAPQESIPLSIPPQSISSRLDTRPQPIITSASALGAPRSAMSVSPYEMSLTPSPDDANLYSRISKQKSKLSRANDQFDSACSEITDNMRASSQDITSVCQNFKTFLAEQNREMSRLSMDFQQQSAQMTRNINSTMASIESAFRDALSSYQTNRLSAPVSSRPSKTGRVVKYVQAESDDYETSESTDQWMYEPKKHLRRKTRVIE